MFDLIIVLGFLLLVMKPATREMLQGALHQRIENLLGIPEEATREDNNNQEASHPQNTWEQSMQLRSNGPPQ